MRAFLLRRVARTVNVPFRIFRVLPITTATAALVGTKRLELAIVRLIVWPDHVQNVAK